MNTQITSTLLTLALLLSSACAAQGEQQAAQGMCLPGTPTPESSSQPSIGPTPWPSNQDEIAELQAKVEDTGARYADVFAGTALDTDAGLVYVWRKPSPDFDRAVGELPGGQKVSFLCAPHSAAELKPIVQRLVGDYEAWKAKGLPLHTIWARHDGVCVEVGTQDPARAQRELGQEYPSYPLCHVEGHPRVPFSDRQ